jgi:hypothetical protein
MRKQNYLCYDIPDDKYIDEYVYGMQSHMLSVLLEVMLKIVTPANHVENYDISKSC